MKKKMNFITAALLLFGISHTIQNAAIAQIIDSTNNALKFNFVVPGARSLALGGAFLGRADDATAAYTNPAGLTNLSQKEFSIEARSWSFNHITINKGRIEGFDIRRIGVDELEGLRSGQLESHVIGASFLSFVYPIRVGEKIGSLAFYRTELANFEIQIETQGAFLNRHENNPVHDHRENPVRGSGDLLIVNYGFGAAFAPVPSLSVGITLSYYDLSMDFSTSRYFTDNADLEGVGGFYGPPDFTPGNLSRLNTQVGDDADVGINVGFLWRIGTSWSLGGVYRQGPDFSVAASSRIFNRKGELDREHIPPDGASLHVPDIYGLGLAFSPSQKLTIAFDYDRVEYSDLNEGIVDIYNLAAFRLDPQLDDFKLDDTDELHLGFEYDFSKRDSLTTFVVRLGAWFEPDHDLRFEADCSSERDHRQQDLCYNFDAGYLPGGDELHTTGGFGISFRRFTIDVGFDLSDRIDTFSLSTVFRPW